MTAVTSLTPRSGIGWPRRPRLVAPPRWGRGSRCGPPRSGLGPCPGGRAQLVPPPPKDPSDAEQPDLEREGDPFDRVKVQKRLKSAERALNQLGRITPLALEEFDAMGGRPRFLSEQLDDLKKPRRDLMDIVKEVDDRVEQAFTEAYRDVEVAFRHVFSRLFPGGEGRLVLTDPDDMLGTGIDVEARPPGKKVKRLSLLSG